MKKTKSISLDAVLSRQLKNTTVRLCFEEQRFYLEIARLVSHLRSKSGLSQAALAKSAGVSQPLIARLEKGDPRRTPTFDLISKVLKVLGHRLELWIRAA